MENYCIAVENEFDGYSIEEIAVSLNAIIDPVIIASQEGLFGLIGALEDDKVRSDDKLKTIYDEHISVLMDLNNQYFVNKNLKELTNEKDIQQLNDLIKDTINKLVEFVEQEQM